MKDLAMFGRVISVGLVIAGYTFLGVWLSNWLSINGYSEWLSFAAIPAGTIIGLWQGWLFLNKKNERGRKDR